VCGRPPRPALPLGEREARRRGPRPARRVPRGSTTTATDGWFFAAARTIVGPADVDLLDALVGRRAASDRRGERVEVHHDQVERRDAEVVELRTWSGSRGRPGCRRARAGAASITAPSDTRVSLVTGVAGVTSRRRASRSGRHGASVSTHSDPLGQPRRGPRGRSWSLKPSVHQARADLAGAHSVAFFSRGCPGVQGGRSVRSQDVTGGRGSANLDAARAASGAAGSPPPRRRAGICSPAVMRRVQRSALMSPRRHLPPPPARRPGGYYMSTPSSDQVHASSPGDPLTPFYNAHIRTHSLIHLSF
jgi:hypothetical protein